MNLATKLFLGIVSISAIQIKQTHESLAEEGATQPATT
jgi:hypothetical protein